MANVQTSGKFELEKVINAGNEIDSIISNCLPAMTGGMKTFTESLTIAKGIHDLKSIMLNTPEIRQVVMSMMDSRLGFLTDRSPAVIRRNQNNGRGPTKEYGYDELVDPIIEGLLKGYRINNNEMNIISGQFYAAKNGNYRKVIEFPGMTNFSYSNDPPIFSADGKNARVQCRATWKLNGVPMNIGIADDDKLMLQIRVNAGMGEDGIIGKAHSKLFKRVLERISGQIMPESTDIDGESIIPEAETVDDDQGAPADMSMYGGNGNAEGQPESQPEAPKETAPPATVQTEEKTEPLGLSMNENQLIELLQRQLEGVGVKSPESFAHVLDYLGHNVKTTGQQLIDVLRVAVNTRPAQLMLSVTEWHASKAEKQAAGTDWDPRENDVMNRYVAEKSAKVKAVAEEMGIATDGRKPSEVHADILAACQEPPDDIVDPGPGSGTGDGRHDEHQESIPDIRNIALELRNKNQVRWDAIVKTLIRAKQVRTTFIEGMSPEELELICDEFRAADEDKF